MCRSVRQPISILTTHIAANAALRLQALRVNKEGRNTFEPQDSPVVCFEPGAPDIHGAHAPAMRDENFGAFPPNTLCVC